MDSIDNASWTHASELGSAVASQGVKSAEADVRLRRQAAVLAFGRRTNAQPPLAVLMQDAVALVADILGADFSGVSKVVGNGASLELTIAAVGEESGCSIDSCMDNDRGPNERGQGPVPQQNPLESRIDYTKINKPTVHECRLDATDSMGAFTLNSASPVVSPNLSTDERFRDTFLLKLGARSAIAVPLHVSGRAFGTLEVYSAKAEAFIAEDTGFAETIAHLLSSSIAREQMESQLKEQLAFSSTVLDIVDALVVAVDVDGRLLSINRACQQVTRFSVAEVRGKSFWDVFVTPKELDLVRGIFRSAQTDNGPCEFESLLLTKAGDERRISWSLKVMRDSHERSRSVVMTGIDRTEQAATETELHKVRSVADRATKALAKLCDGTRQTDRPSENRTAADQLRTEDIHAKPSPFQPLGDKESSGAELRTSQRRSFQYQQMIAPMIDGAMPTRDDFFPVDCKDISASGISFLLDRKPNFENLVVALGRPPSISYFIAKVARVAGVEDDGQKMYLVGCRFTKRTSM